MNREGIRRIEVNINSDKRGIGKTTLAMTIVKYLRSLEYKTVYEGHSHDNTRLIEEQMKRTSDRPLYIAEDVTIFVKDKN